MLMSCCLLEDRAIKFVFFDSNGGSSFLYLFSLVTSDFLRTFAAEDITSRSPSIDGEVGSLTGMRDAGWAMLLSSTGMSAGEPSFWLSDAVPGSSNRRRTG